MTEPIESKSLTPRFSAAAAIDIAKRHFGLDVDSLHPLPSYDDQNFSLQAGDQRFVLKIWNSSESRDSLELQLQVISRLQEHGIPCPQTIASVDGTSLVEIEGDGARHFVQLLTWLDGTIWKSVAERPPELFRDLGGFLAHIDNALQGFDHPAAHRDYDWKMESSSVWVALLCEIPDPARRRIAAQFLVPFETRIAPALASLPQGVIHSDANDTNLFVDPESARITGICDFGDSVHGAVVAELGISAGYAVLDVEDPLAAATQMVAGYHSVRPLLEEEVDLVFELMALRLCVSVTSAAHRKKLDPDNAYLFQTEERAWRALERLIEIGPAEARASFRGACGMTTAATSSQELLDKRRRLLGPNLSLAYQKPLHIVRGCGQYLYTPEGRAYLDMVNNVCHVGHCHPRVVAAAQGQMAVLNTNTRYLHEHIVRYAERLAATLPDPLEVCFFVNTGSEANELALRLARTATGGTDFVVVDGAYHGHTSSLIEISPYKFDRKGGAGAPAHVHKVPMPDGYRGLYKSRDPQAGSKYAAHVAAALDEIAGKGRKAAAFISESALGCGGQVFPPPGFLAESFAHTRSSGGLCIADEVQVGFGRVGSHFWGFEIHGVVPDIVTLGKPIGNGHPLGAVVTTRAIADAFANGMEYFNTFGGNPVSCAVGLAVLDVIEEEGLQEHARQVGGRMLDDLRKLQGKHALIGDVRGQGLFVGIELVRDHETLEPATEEASAVVEAMKERGILLSTDGPLGNVIKIKPPMVFSMQDEEHFVETLDEVLSGFHRSR